MLSASERRIVWWQRRQRGRGGEHGGGIGEEKGLVALSAVGAKRRAWRRHRTGGERGSVVGGGKEEKIPAKQQIKIDNVMRIMNGATAVLATTVSIAWSS